jgi:hypothetical protein
VTTLLSIHPTCINLISSFTAAADPSWRPVTNKSHLSRNFIVMEVDFHSNGSLTVGNCLRIHTSIHFKKVAFICLYDAIKSPLLEENI